MFKRKNTSLNEAISSPGPLTLKETMWGLLRDKLQKHCPDPRQKHTKTMVRIWGELESLKERMRSEGGAPSIRDELDRIALTVAYAVFNPIETTWDVDRFADSVKQVKLLAKQSQDEAINLGLACLSKFYEAPGELRKEEEPATVLDRHSRIVVWSLPGIICDYTLEEYNNAVVSIRSHLDCDLVTNVGRTSSFVAPANGGRFGAGLKYFSPGWFMQAQERLIDKLHSSASLQSQFGANFLQRIHHTELLCNAVTALVTPEMYDIGLSAIQKTKSGVSMASLHENVELWPSVFTALEVIVNRNTGPHRDKGGCSTHFDLLVSLGTHKNAVLHLRELGLSFPYLPGTMAAICGKVFLHEIIDWEGGEGDERICIAHFMKDAVHCRLGLPRPGWPKQDMYMSLIA